MGVRCALVSPLFLVGCIGRERDSIGRRRAGLREFVRGHDVGKSLGAIGGDVDDVLAVITVVRKWHLDVCAGQHPQPDTQCQDVHLPASVVDVVFLVDLVAGRDQEVRDRRAIGSVAAVPDMQGARWIRGDVLDYYLAAGADVARAITLTTFDDVDQFSVERRGGQAKVDEARPCDLDRFHEVRRRQSIHDGLGDIARAVAERFRQAHRDAACVVPVLSVPCPLDLDRDRFIQRSDAGEGVDGRPD